MSDQYTVLAEFYDELNSQADYPAAAEFALTLFSQNGIGRGATLLDLGCGTGKLTCMLTRSGYDMIGCDISTQMLCRAKEAAETVGLQPFFICQDMRRLELFAPVDGGFCFFDGMNYLNDASELLQTLVRLRENLAPGAVFIFDLNTEYKYENVYGENVYVYDEENVYCIWQNFYDRKERKCDFDLTFFVKNRERNSYRRLDEHQRQTCFAEEDVQKAIEKSGFSLIAEYSGFDMSPPGEHDEKRYYVIKRM